MNDSQPWGLPPERKRDEPGDELFVEERTFPDRSKERLVLNSVLGEMRPEVPGWISRISQEPADRIVFMVAHSHMSKAFISHAAEDFHGL
jgi:hypothetical protein